MEWFLVAFKKYAEFSGRARRKEYWMFWLFYYLFGIGLVIVELITGSLNYFIGLGPLSLLFSLVMLIPSISVTVRRLHDIDKSGWFIFINLIPIIGQIWLLILLITDSTAGNNKYGDNPKGVEYKTNNEKIEDNTLFHIAMSFLISAFIAFGTFALFTYIPIFDSLENTYTIKQIIMITVFIISFIFIFKTYLKDDKMKTELKQ